MISSKEFEPREELKESGLNGDTPMGFEKVQIVPTETLIPKMAKVIPKKVHV